MSNNTDTTAADARFERITQSQHMDVMNSPTMRGKYFYMMLDKDVPTPFVAIDKSRGEVEVAAHPTIEAMIAWLDDDGLEPVPSGNGNGIKPPSRLDAKTTARVTQLAGLGLKYNGQEYIKDDFNVHWTEITADDDAVFADKVERIKAEMARREENPLPDLPASKDDDIERQVDSIFGPRPGTTQAGAAPVGEVSIAADENDLIPIDELKGRVEREEAAYFPLYRRAAVLEAELKAKQQQFDKDYAFLIADKKAAVEERNAAATALKALAVSYGRRTGEKQFDQYISFRENDVITWDEPEAIAWLGQNFPAALINPGVSIDATRFKTYIKDCRKKKQPLPPSVKIGTEWETTISSKIPVPELEGKAS